MATSAFASVTARMMIVDAVQISDGADTERRVVIGLGFPVLGRSLPRNHPVGALVARVRAAGQGTGRAPRKIKKGSAGGADN